VYGSLFIDLFEPSITGSHIFNVSPFIVTDVCDKFYGENASDDIENYYIDEILF